MVDALAEAVTLYSLGLTGWALAGTLTGRRPPALVVGACVLEAALVLLAVLDAVSAPATTERATHLGYLVVSVVLLPTAFGWAGRDRTRWGSATLALAFLCVAVVVVRLRQTVH